jgi:septal ring factor EnvC (AmiA/AmiB activator)
VRDAGTAMNDIVSGVERVTVVIGEISSATNEQSQGIALVNTAVNELDQMTQQNAALVEESAAAADSLREQAAKLAEAVSAFRLEQGQPPVQHHVQAEQVIQRARSAAAKPVTAEAGTTEWESF